MIIKFSYYSFHTHAILESGSILTPIVEKKKRGRKKKSEMMSHQTIFDLSNTVTQPESVSSLESYNEESMTTTQSNTSSATSHHQNFYYGECSLKTNSPHDIEADASTNQAQAEFYTAEELRSWDVALENNGSLETSDEENTSADEETALSFHSMDSQDDLLEDKNLRSDNSSEQNQISLSFSWSLMNQLRQMARLEGISPKELVIELVTEGMTKRVFEDQNRPAPSHLMTRTGYVPPDGKSNIQQPQLSHHQMQQRNHSQPQRWNQFQNRNQFQNNNQQRINNNNNNNNRNNNASGYIPQQQRPQQNFNNNAKYKNSYFNGNSTPNNQPQNRTRVNQTNGYYSNYNPNNQFRSDELFQDENTFNKKNDEFND